MAAAFNSSENTFIPSTATERWEGAGHDFVPLRMLNPNDYKYFLYKMGKEVGIWRNDKLVPHDFGTWGLPWSNPIPRDPRMSVVGYAPGFEPYVYLSQIGGGGTVYRVWSRHVRITTLRYSPQPGTNFAHEGESWLSYDLDFDVGTNFCPFTYPPSNNRLNPNRRRIVWPNSGAGRAGH